MVQVSCNQVRPIAQLLEAGGGTDIHTWRVIAGQLPTGLTLDEYTGYISGTPVSVGTSTFIVEVEDSDGAVATQKLNITISDLNIITEDPTKIPNEEVDELRKTLKTEKAKSAILENRLENIESQIQKNKERLRKFRILEGGISQIKS